MEDLSPFTSHFARLTWLLAHRPDDIDEQKEELRQSLTHLSTGRREVVLHDISVAVSNAVSRDAPDESLIWLGELSVRMSAHSVRMLEFEAAAAPREVLEVARALAGMPKPGDDGLSIDQALVGLALTAVSAHIGPMGFVRRARAPESSVAIRASEASMATIPAGIESVTSLDRSTPAMMRAVRRTDAEAQLLQDQLMPLAAPGEGGSALVSRLDTAVAASNPIAVVDDVARAAEDRARAGKWDALLEVMRRMHQQHDRLHDGDAKRAFLMGIRRLERPELMHGLARLLPERRDQRDDIGQILARAGETGADVLIDNLINSDVAAERRAYRDALGQCPAATGALVHLLDDERWYVVRNAVELLGELDATSADGALAAQLSHGEPRVRRAVAGSLGRLGTSRAVLALLQSTSDPSPEVRLQVARALGAVRNTRTVPWLIEALDREVDAEVQGALLAALGHTPTEDAVARLSRAAEPGGVLLRKPLAQRLRAVEALGEAGTPVALSALRSLLQDRDREVRDAAQRAINRHVPDRL